MKKYLIAGLIFSLLILGAEVSFAEWFFGEVQQVDPEAGTIMITEIDPITDTEETLEILVEDATVFSGVESLEDIRADDDVTIEVQYDEATDAWKALSIEVAEAGA